MHEHRMHVKELSRTVDEGIKVKIQYYTGFVPSGLVTCSQYKQLQFANMTIKLEAGKNYTFTNTGITLVCNILHCGCEVKWLCQEFCDLAGFCNYTLESSTLGTYCVVCLSKQLFLVTAKFKLKANV